ncbi:AAA-like domain-containing protein [Armatimonas sp.]|uniref:AAA-like domain-containing protein n=1 Tax=Armatimonas sp. TaxID=1872638 RepID=UPI00286AF1FF|nr:AAA-like domain-containing protein [Armatimonas sp.]
MNHQISREKLTGGALHPEDHRYVLRPADRFLEEAVRRSDTSIILVKGPRETGKSSLMIRCLHQEQARGAMTLVTDFKAFPRSAFETMENLCLAILLQLAAQLAQIKGGEIPTAEDEARVSKMPTIGLEQFIQRRVLNQNMETTILWAMDRVDRLFGTPSGPDFFSLLRSWHDKRTQLASRTWRRLKIVVVTSTEAVLFLKDLNQSPFNVGLKIELADFSSDEAQTLNKELGEPLAPLEQASLYALLSGHPRLMGQAMQAVNDGALFSELLPQLDQADGPFGEHLQRLEEFVNSRPEHRSAVDDVIAGKSCATEPFLMLRSAGVLAGDASDAPRMRCPLYARFLQRKNSR